MSATPPHPERHLRTVTGHRRPAALAGLLTLLVSILTVLGPPAPAQAATRTQTQAGPGPFGTPAPVDAEVIAQVAGGGQVPVIVQLATDFRPDAALSVPARAGQRASVRATADEVLADLPTRSHGEVTRSRTVPLLALAVDARALGHLAADPTVAAVFADHVDDVTLATSTTRIGAPTLWSAGTDGTGQTVAILDTGVDSTHSFLAGKVVDEACFSKDVALPNLTSASVCADGDNPPGTTSERGPGSAMPCPIAGHDCDHGTNVAGIAAGGDGTSGSGVAPGADIIAVQVFSEFAAANCGNGGSSPCARTWTSDQILGLEHVYALRTTHDIAAVNMSLGGARYTAACTGDPRRAIIQNLATAGIATVVSSGNESYVDAMGAPACIPEAISVGATSKTSDAVAGFSNSASFLDLLAPGVSIRSAIPHEGWANYTGTSMAAPHVTGAFALLGETRPASSVASSLDALVTTGVPVLDPKSGITTPRIQVDAAAATLAAAPAVVTSLGPTVGPTTGGTIVTISGSGFTGTTGLRFGPTAALSFTVVDDSTITAVTPSGPAGLVNVWVDAPTGTNGNASSSWFTFQVPPTIAPTVTSVTPALGTVAGGTAVTLKGTGFLTASTVRFGPAAAASFTVVNDTTITAVTPPFPTALTNVWVTNPIGTNPNQPSSWYWFRVITGPAPAVTALDPSSGPAAGGQVVTMTGSGFTGVTQVRFGPTTATSVTVVSDTTLTVITPPRPVGLVNIWVTSANGTSTNQLSSWYSFT